MISNNLREEVTALCNRVNQLEKLVISQAREIIDLKRILQINNNNNNLMNISQEKNPSVPIILNLNNNENCNNSIINSNRNSQQIFQQQQTSFSTNQIISNNPLTMTINGNNNMKQPQQQKHQQQHNQTARTINLIAQNHQQSIPNSNRNSMIILQPSKQQQQKPVSVGPQRCPITIDNNNLKQLNNNMINCRPNNHPYHMNPIVHPTSAIPPINNSSKVDYSTNRNSPAPTSSLSPSSSTSSSSKSPPSSTTNSSDGITINSNEKLGRQSLVENEKELIEEGEIPPSPSPSSIDEDNKVDEQQLLSKKRKKSPSDWMENQEQKDRDYDLIEQDSILSPSLNVSQEDIDDPNMPPIYLSFDKSPSGQIIYFKHSDRNRKPILWNFNNKDKEREKEKETAPPPTPVQISTVWVIDENNEKQQQHLVPPSLRELLDNSPFA